MFDLVLVFDEHCTPPGGELGLLTVRLHAWASVLHTVGSQEALRGWTLSWVLSSHFCLLTF